MNAMDAALICRALGDSNRIQIVELLMNGEMCGCRLLEHFQIAQPTLSHHMKILCDSGLVNGRKEGKWMHYSIHSEGVGKAERMMQRLLTPNDPAADCGCEEV